MMYTSKKYASHMAAKLAQNPHATVRARISERLGAVKATPAAGLTQASILDAMCPEVLHERPTFTVR